MARSCCGKVQEIEKPRRSNELPGHGLDADSAWSKHIPAKGQNYLRLQLLAGSHRTPTGAPENSRRKSLAFRLMCRQPGTGARIAARESNPAPPVQLPPRRSLSSRGWLPFACRENGAYQRRPPAKVKRHRISPARRVPPIRRKNNARPEPGVSWCPASVFVGRAL